MVLTNFQQSTALAMDRLKAIESFVAVAKFASYSKAAKHFGVSRALLSKRISEMEERLGVRLINRNTHRLSLTDAGLSYLANCQTILSEVESAELSLMERRNVARGNLRVLTSKTFGFMHMGGAVAEFMTQHPGIQVSLTARDMSRQSFDLIGEGYDVAVRTMGMNDSTLLARKIARLRWVVVAVPAYLQKHGVPKVPGDLVRHNCLAVNSDEQRWIFESGGRTEIMRVFGNLRTNISMIVRDAVLQGLGIGLLPEYCIVPELTDGRLIRLLRNHTCEERSLLAIFQKDRHLPLKVRLFVDFLAEHFRGQPWSHTSKTKNKKSVSALKHFVMPRLRP
jgi:DNA-binding transcriptional LysR family regulator